MNDNDNISILGRGDVPGAIWMELSESCRLEGAEATAIFRGEMLPETPIEFIRQEGEEDVDYVGTSFTGPISLISTRFAELLRTNEITGWSTYPVSIDSRGVDLEFSYVGLSITGRCGPIDDSRSRKVKRRTIGGVDREMYVGLHPDMSQWDGSDMFNPRAYLTFVNSKVRSLVESAGLRNIEFENPTEARNFALPKNSVGG